jgi:hypothetical protein
MKMKPAITRTTTILVSVLASGLALAQSPITIIQNTRDTMSSVSSHATAASNQALATDEVPSRASATHSSTKSGPSIATPAHSLKVESTPKHATPKKRVGAIAVVTNAPAPGAPTAPKVTPVAAIAPANPAPETAPGENEQSVVPDSKYAAANGRRDPFISPVVSHAGGSGCSTGKKCLEIGAINLRGVVHSEGGFIAVVSNGLNKAYFLRENDPVFNGYVVKITGDSIVFQETLQDRLGKSFTREVVKKITTPAV